jgi:hypothetical protein
MKAVNLASRNKGDQGQCNATERVSEPSRGNLDEGPTAEPTSFDALSAYLREAWELNSSYEPPSFGQPYRTPMWEFVRRAKAHPDLGRLGEFEALAGIEKCLRSWGNASENEDIWEVLFPDSDDPRAEFIYTWPRIKCAAAILELAQEEADRLPLKPLKSCSPKYDRFLGVVAICNGLLRAQSWCPAESSLRCLGASL